MKKIRHVILKQPLSHTGDLQLNSVRTLGAGQHGQRGPTEVMTLEDGFIRVINKGVEALIPLHNVDLILFDKEEPKKPLKV